MARPAFRVAFSAKVRRSIDPRDGGFVRLPQEVSEQVPTRTQFPVDGTLNGGPFAVVLEPDNEGGHWFLAPSFAPLGQDAEIELWTPAVEPEQPVPDDLRIALAANPIAQATWNETTPIARRDWITWMGQGRKAETRVIRLEKMMDMLSHGKKRVCCYDRSGMASKAFYVPVEAGD